MFSYQVATPGIGLFDNTTVRLDADNEPQPDALLRIENGGQTIISQDDYLEGAPEFIAEIAASSASYDLRDKLRAYRRNQVQEYLVWQVNEQKIDWFRLREGEYIVLPSDATGTIKSEVFPSLWLYQFSVKLRLIISPSLWTGRGLGWGKFKRIFIENWY